MLEIRPPSKTQRKNELDRLKALGAELVELSAGKLAMLSLPDDLHTAIDAARRISSRSARKRQLLTVGRLMEDVDANAIHAQLAAIDHPDTRQQLADAVRPQAAAHPLAASLLDGDDTTLFALSDRYEHRVLQDLRQIIRQVRKLPQRDAALLELSKALEQLP